MAWLGACARLSSDVDRVVNVNHAALGAPTLSMTTFNMLHGFGNSLNDATLEERRELLAKGIAETQPVIVILQEGSDTPRKHGDVVNGLRESVNRLLVEKGISYNSVSAMANGSPLIGFFEGSAILSRFEIRAAESRVYRAQALFPPKHRIALRAQIASSVGEVTIIGTHLTNTGARAGGRLKRTLQAEELAAWAVGGAAATTVVIIGGDFNDDPGSPTIRALAAARARDAWAFAAQGGQEMGRGLTGLSRTVTDADDAADERIDYIFLLGNRASVAWARPFLDHPFARSGGGVLWASDHVGVTAGVQIIEAQ